MPTRAGLGIGLSQDPRTPLGMTASTPSGALAETISAPLCTTDGSVLSTGRMSLVGIYLYAGTVVTSATFLSGGTPLGTGTHQWFALYSSALALLKQTSNDTNAAWAANTKKTLNFTSTYTVTTTGFYYLGINVTASTVPTLRTWAMSSGVSTQTPLLTGFSTSSLTTTAPDPAAAITSQTNIPYGYVS